MESGILMTGVVLLALTASPILYIHYNRSRKQHFLEKALAQYAIAHKLQVSDYDLWNQQYAITVDDTHSYLIHLQVSGKSVIDMKLLMNKGTKASVVKKDKGVDLLVKDPKGKGTLLEFYSGTELDTMEDEIKLAEKWAAIINNFN